MAHATKRTAIQVYGTDECEDTLLIREFLDRLAQPYEYIDITKFPEAAAWAREKAGGKQRTPVVDVSGMILVEPSNEELRSALESAGAVEH